MIYATSAYSLIGQRKSQDHVEKRNPIAQKEKDMLVNNFNDLLVPRPWLLQQSIERKRHVEDVLSYGH